MEPPRSRRDRARDAGRSARDGPPGPRSWAPRPVPGRGWASSGAASRSSCWTRRSTSLRLRVVTVDGGHPSLGAFAARELLMLVDGFAWGLAGIVVMLVSKRRQRIGDIGARTLVVRAPRSADQPAFPGPDGADRADVGLDRGHRHHE
ncbi:RDD family protein [Amycolatopsis sp. NPDC049159]|uniref:RDD family protein n=1 Tax=Amycolatopsis sp. NPDC049159 TaxID=3157210 RepID=UPI0033DF152B